MLQQNQGLSLLQNSNGVDPSVVQMRNDLDPISDQQPLQEREMNQEVIYLII